MSATSPSRFYRTPTSLPPKIGIALALSLAMLGPSCSIFDGVSGDDPPEDIDAAPPIDCVTLPGLVVHLPFDEGSGLSAADISANGNNGVLFGMDDTDWVSGRFGTALDFDGNDQFVSSGSGPTIADLPSMSMCAWIQPRSFASQFPAIADKSKDGFTGGWNFYVEDGNLLGFLTNHQKFATGGTIRLDAWQHVCATWDGSGGTNGITLYIDGLPIAITETGSNGDAIDSDAERELRVGGTNDGTLDYDGLTDDFQLYSRVLAPDEIETLHRCGDL